MQLKARHAFKAIQSVTPNFDWPVSINCEGQDLHCQCSYKAESLVAPEHKTKDSFGFEWLREGYKAIVAHYAATLRLIEQSNSTARDHAIACANRHATAMVLHEAKRQGEQLDRPDPAKEAFIKAVLG